MPVRILETFSEGYLASLRRSDLEVITELVVRDIELIRVLPRDQRIALGNLLRDKIDLIERE